MFMYKIINVSNFELFSVTEKLNYPDIKIIDENSFCALKYIGKIRFVKYINLNSYESCLDNFKDEIIKNINDNIDIFYHFCIDVKNEKLYDEFLDVLITIENNIHKRSVKLNASIR